MIQLLPCCRFPAVERMGQDVLSVQRLTHGYQDRTLFKNCDFEMEKSERVALIGTPCSTVPMFLNPPLAFCLSPPHPLPAATPGPHTCCEFTHKIMCSATNDPSTSMFFLFRFAQKNLFPVCILTKEKIHSTQSDGGGKQARIGLNHSHRTDHSYLQEPSLCSCCMCCWHVGRSHGHNPPPPPPHIHTAGLVNVTAY